MVGRSRLDVNRSELQFLIADQIRCLRQEFPFPSQEIFERIASLTSAVDALDLSSDLEINRKYLDDFEGALDTREAQSRHESEYAQSVSLADSAKWCYACTEVSSGEGLFWELLQDAWDLQDHLSDASECDNYDDVYKDTCDSLRYLLEMTTKRFPEPAAVSSFRAKGPQKMMHRDLRLAVHFLLVLARTLPEEDVQYTIVRLVYCCEPFLNFIKSDPKARGILLSGGFRLMDVMRQRNMDVTDAIKLSNGFLALLVKENKALAGALSSPLNVRSEALEELHLPLGNKLLKSHDDHLAYLKMLSTANENLILLMLVHMQRMCCCMSDSVQQGEGEFKFLSDTILHLFNADATVNPLVSVEALKILYIMMDAFEKGRAYAALEKLVQFIDGQLLGSVEHSMIKNFPAHRNPDRTLRATQKKHLKVIPFTLQFLAKVHSVQMSFKLKQWPTIKDFTSKLSPPPGTLWENLPLAHRTLTLTYYSHILDSAPNHPLNQAETAALIDLWIKAMLDHGSGKALVVYTMALAAHPSTKDLLEGCEICGFSVKQLKGGECGPARAGFVQHLFRKILEAGPNGLMLRQTAEKVEKVVKIRDQELQQEKGCSEIERLKWQHVSASMITVILTMGCTRTSPAFVPTPFAASLLKLCCQWVFDSVVFFEKAYMNHQPGRPASKSSLMDVFSVAEARQSLKATTAGLAPSLISIFQQIGTVMQIEATRTQLKPFHFLILSCLKVPVASIGPNPVDLAVFEIFGAALDPSVVNGAGEGGLANYGNSGQQGSRLEMLHFLLRSYVWGFLEKSSLNSANFERWAVNSLHFLCTLFTQPGLRNLQSFFTLLPCVLGPLVGVLHPPPGRSPSLKCKKTVYHFLCQLVKEHPEVVTRPPADCNDVRIPGSIIVRGGPLKTGACVDTERMNEALRVFMVVCVRDVLSCVCTLLPNDYTCRLSTANQGPIAKYKPLAASDAGEAQTSFMKVFGRPNVSNQVDQMLREHDVTVPNFISASGWEQGSELDVAQQAFKFLSTLPSISEEGVHWVLPALLPLQTLLESGLSNVRPLIQPYKELLELLRGYDIDVTPHRLQENRRAQEYAQRPNIQQASTLHETNTNSTVPNPARQVHPQIKIEQDVKMEDVVKTEPGIKQEPGINLEN